MTAIEKIIMVDRVLEKLTDEQMAQIKSDYAEYSAKLFEFVNDIKIHDKEVRVAIFSAMLSPYQYFIEDVVRMKRLNENRLEGGQQAQHTQQTSRGPTGGQQAYRPKWKKY